MADLGPSISQLTKTCRHELDELSSSHRDAVKRIGHDTLAEPPTALDLLAWVPEQKTKLNLFADVLGVFASGPLSVEHRLRNNSAVRSSIAQLLEAISKNLCLCIRSRVQLAGPQQTTDDDPIEPAPAYDVTKIACRRIGRDVANLVRFAALIRLRSMQQYRERSEHHEPLDHDGLPLGDYFDKVVTRALKEIFEDTGMAELDDSSQDIQQSVPHRIRQTVTSRWKRICYHIARYQQLRGSDSPAEENVDDEDIVMENVQFDADVKHAVPLRGDGIHASKNVVVPQHEKATTFQGSLNEQAKVPQPPSITPSVALTNVAGFSVRMPRLRKQDVTYENGMLEFLCPLCKIPQQLPSDRSAVHQHRAWEKHAFYDLEPYICLLECKTPEATYRTFEDWTRHINNEHARYTWQCQNCTESCDNQAAFEQHLRSQHEAKLTAGELAFIAKTCERPVAAFSTCFFCGKYELSGQAEAETRDAAALRQRKMMRCMAQHMRSMALTSLPDQLSVSDGSAESAARVSDASEASARFRTVTQSNAKSTNPSSEAFESILSQLKAQYEETDGRAEFTNEWRLKSDLMSSDNRPADLPQLMLDPEKLSQQYWLSTTDLDCVGEGPPRYDGKPLTFDDNEPLSRAVTIPSSYWSVPEQTDFDRYIAHFGTDFAAIANHMRTKSQLMVKNHFQRQVDGGRADLAEQAEQANQRRKRGEDMGPPPTPTPISKRKYDTLETIVSHGFPSQTLPMPLDADHPEAALETPRKSTEGSTGVLPAIEDDGYISDEIDPVGNIEVSRGDRMPSDVQDENRFASQTYPGPLQQEGQGGGPSRSMTLPGMDQDSPKSPASNKRHKCPYCATEFTRHHNLKSHLLTHSQEKPYVCQTCQARFRRLHDLKRHTKLHIGERPHTCDKCGRKFARDDALARHNKAPGGCAGGQSSFGDEDDGRATYNSLDEAASSRNAAPSTVEVEHAVDLAGDLKVSKDGQLRGGREYQCRTFTLPRRGTTLYMLATECARVLGYHDSDILFNENQILDKIVIGQAEKDDLLDRNILPRFDRARQVAVVTARSMFRQFGSRMIEDGQPGRDDYWEADAQDQIFDGYDLPLAVFSDEFPSHSGTRDLVGNNPTEGYEAVWPVSPLPLPIDSTSADPLRDSKKSLIPRKGRKRPAIRCLACSELDIRCDPGVEGCVQCARAGIPCRMRSANAESSRDPNELRDPPEAQQGRAESCLACRERKVRCDPGDNGCLQCAERGTPCRMLGSRRVKPSGPTSQYPMPLEQHEKSQSKASEIARPEDSMDVDSDDEGDQALHQARVHDQLGVPLNTVSF